MATPREFSSYPAEYAELFIKASSEEVRIELSSASEALRLRGRLYAFRNALYESPEKSPEAALLAPLVQLAVKRHVLIVSPLEPAVQSLDEALNESSSEIPGRDRQHDAGDSEVVHGKAQK